MKGVYIGAVVSGLGAYYAYCGGLGKAKIIEGSIPELRYYHSIACKSPDPLLEKFVEESTRDTSHSSSDSQWFISHHPFQPSDSHLSHSQGMLLPAAAHSPIRQINGDVEEEKLGPCRCIKVSMRVRGRWGGIIAERLCKRKILAHASTYLFLGQGSLQQFTFLATSCFPWSLLSTIYITPNAYFYSTLSQLDQIFIPNTQTNI